MHNKLFVADNALAITGGRNIGDEYFTRDPRSDFIDLDVVAAGPIVPQLSSSFDAFWNSEYAYPIASLASPVSAEPASVPLLETDTGVNPNWLGAELNAGLVHLIWVPATVLADRPAKISSAGTRKSHRGTPSLHRRALDLRGQRRRRRGSPTRRLR